VHDGGREGRLAVIDVADGADVDVYPVSVELFLSHFFFFSFGFENPESMTAK
jgi:hypothetical protein